MKDELLKVISKNTEYSLEECKGIYEQLKSYDTLLLVLNMASAYQIAPQNIVDFIYESQN